MTGRHRHLAVVPDDVAPRGAPVTGEGSAGGLVEVGCPACPIVCPGCLDTRLIWIPSELLAIPGAQTRLLDSVRVVATGVSLPGARLLDDGRIAFGAAEGRMLRDLPDPARRRAAKRLSGGGEGPW